MRTRLVQARCQRADGLYRGKPYLGGQPRRSQALTAELSRLFLGIILGAIAGSFIATLVERWGQGKSILGRSQCNSCQTQVRASELIPLVSYVLQRGRCRNCSAPIGRSQFDFEFLCAFLGSVAISGVPGWEGYAGAFFCWLLFALVLLDVSHFWLPNSLTFILAATGLAFGMGSLQDRLIGLAAGFLSLELVRRAYRTIRKREGMGGGDPKLLGGIGAWLGWQVLPLIVLLGALIGLVIAGIEHFRERRSSSISVWKGLRKTGAKQMPLGALLAIAAIGMWQFISL